MLCKILVSDSVLRKDFFPQTEARKSIDAMRNNLGGDLTQSYRMNWQFMFQCVLCSSIS